MAFKIVQTSHLSLVLLNSLKRNLSLSTVYFKDPKDDASAKLNALLQSIIKDDSLGKDSSSKLVSSNEAIIPKKRSKPEKPKDLGQKIVESAAEVAKSLPGKPEETEAQLLHKLLYKDDVLTGKIIRATTGNEVLMGLLSNMPVEEPPPRSSPQKKGQDVEYSRAKRVKDAHGKHQFAHPRTPFIQGKEVDLYGEGFLGIFDVKDFKGTGGPQMDTWETLQKRDFKLLTTHPPNNIWEQMIIWTERGILWKFPIDNAYGLEEEENTDFTDHVFLETYIEDWCPDQGPIRTFMELVCVGLSRNYWLSAKEKKEHILWYKDFFTSKKDLIKELGAGEIKQTALIDQ